MTETENELLGLILSEWVQLSLDDPKQRLGEGFYEWKARAAAITDAARWGVQVDPCWLGSDAAGRQRRSRSLASLVSTGWITRKLFHRRLTFVKPTAMALEAILQATSPKPPPTSEQAAARDAATAAELAASIAETDEKLDALQDELCTGSESLA